MLLVRIMYVYQYIYDISATGLKQDIGCSTNYHHIRGTIRRQDYHTVLDHADRAETTIQQ